LVKIYKLVLRKVSNRLEVSITASFTLLTRKNASMLAKFTYPIISQLGYYMKCGKVTKKLWPAFWTLVYLV